MDAASKLLTSFASSKFARGPGKRLCSRKKNSKGRTLPSTALSTREDRVSCMPNILAFTITNKHLFTWPLSIQALRRFLAGMSRLSIHASDTKREHAAKPDGKHQVVFYHT